MILGSYVLRLKQLIERLLSWKARRDCNEGVCGEDWFESWVGVMKLIWNWTLKQ